MLSGYSWRGCPALSLLIPSSAPQKLPNVDLRAKNKTKQSLYAHNKGKNVCVRRDSN